MAGRKLSSADKAEIRDLWVHGGESTRALSKRFGVSQTVIAREVRGLRREEIPSAEARLAAENHAIAELERALEQQTSLDDHRAATWILIQAFRRLESVVGADDLGDAELMDHEREALLRMLTEMRRGPGFGSRWSPLDQQTTVYALRRITGVDVAG